MMRLLLVFRFKDRIIPTPPIQPLNRDKLQEDDYIQPVKEAFKLKRSGNIIRTVRNSSMTPRTWIPPTSIVTEPIIEEMPGLTKQMFRTSFILAEVKKLVLSLE